MIKASVKGPDGRELLVIGLSFGNLRRFLAEPRDSFVKIRGEDMQLPLDVMIFSCETEAHGAELLQEWINEKTVVHVSDKLKS